MITESIETSAIPEEKRDEAFREWVQLVGFFHRTKVTLFKQEDLDRHCYSFGNIYTLLYGEWRNFCQQPSLKGITLNTFQMIAPLLMQHPQLGGVVSDDDWNATGCPKTNYGIRMDMEEHPYVTIIRKWQELRADYYACHQEEYEWSDSDNEFLPNRLLSDKILEDEIRKHGCMEKYEGLKAQYKEHALATVFHKEVMGKKGSGIMAYTEEIGDKVCKANYYQYETELSQSERRRTGSKRKIYSIINRGKRKQYISLDFRHGMLEFHDEKGLHLGEFRFTGEKNSGAEASHNLLIE